MISRYPVWSLVVGLVMFGATASAWSQDCCKRVYRPSCKVSCGKTSCRPCRPNPLIDVLTKIDCALQRLLPCPKSCCKTACDAKPPQKVKPTCGCGAPLVPVPPEPSPDPFTDDELEAPPVPTVDAKHTIRDAKVARRTGPSPTASASSISPRHFRPMNALPLPRTVSGQKSVLRKDDATDPNSDAGKGRRPLIKSVRLAEFVIP